MHRSVVIQELMRAISDDPFERLHELLDEAENKIDARNDSEDWKHGGIQAVQFVRGKLIQCREDGELRRATFERMKRMFDESWE